MVNNHFNRHRHRICDAYVYMRIFTFVFFCGSSLFVQAEKIEKYYVSSLLKDGTIYHILPQQGFKSEGGSLVYDITYLNSRDSATLNFSYLGELPLSIDSIIFVYTDLRIALPTKAFFMEPRKNKWKHRQTVHISYPALCSLFEREQAPQIILSTSKDLLTLEITPKKWREQSERITKILSLIRFNKKV